MIKNYFKLESIKIFDLFNLDEFNSLRVYLSGDLLLISNKDLISFIYGNSSIIIDTLFSPVYSSGFNLRVYKFSKNIYYELNQIIDLLRLKLDSKFFDYCKNKERQRKLFQTLENYKENVKKNYQ